jgi:hypothetical protein
MTILTIEIAIFLRDIAIASLLGEIPDEGCTPPDFFVSHHR